MQVRYQAALRPELLNYNRATKYIKKSFASNKQTPFAMAEELIFLDGWLSSQQEKMGSMKPAYRKIKTGQKINCCTIGQQSMH
ncbi:MAG: hypothetical protein PHT15_07010 [Gallionellaceae bacterium]|nr:hypothetical protein [Gallionellaceae bacterium]